MDLRRAFRQAIRKSSYSKPHSPMQARKMRLLSNVLLSYRYHPNTKNAVVERETVFRDHGRNSVETDYDPDDRKAHNHPCGRCQGIQWPTWDVEQTCVGKLPGKQLEQRTNQRQIKRDWLSSTGFDPNTTFELSPGGLSGRAFHPREVQRYRENGRKKRDEICPYRVTKECIPNLRVSTVP